MTDHDSGLRLVEWFRQWRLPLRRFLIGRGMVPASDLDDVAQEVFLRLMRYGRTELIEHPQAYLYRMASNVAAEWAIRGRHARALEPEWVSWLATEEGTNPAQEADQLELQDEIERALRALTLQQREVLKLQFYASLNRRQIAERTGLSERSVKRTLARGYARLRQELSALLPEGTSHGG